MIEGGQVKRLSVAVAVDDQRVPSADGKSPAKWVARTPEQLKSITELVKSAVGFDEKRGDTVTVDNIAFARPDIPLDDAKAPGPFSFDKFDIVHGVEIGALFITALALVFFVLRPLVKGMFSRDEDKLAGALGGPGNAPAGQQNGSNGGDNSRQIGMNEGKSVAIDMPTPERLDAGIDVARISGQVKASSIKKISEVVSTHPDESIGIIRSWLAEEGGDRAA